MFVLYLNVTLQFLFLFLCELTENARVEKDACMGPLVVPVKLETAVHVGFQISWVFFFLSLTHFPTTTC